MLTISLFACALGMFQTQQASQPETPVKIVLDGKYEEWRTLDPAVRDPQDAAGAEIDFGAITVAHDNNYVFLLAEFGNRVCPQRLIGSAQILLDIDGDAMTGETLHDFAGVDAIVTFTPPNKRDPSRRGMGVGLTSTTYEPDPADETAKPLTPYNIGMEFRPTYASEQFEVRLGRGFTVPETPPFFVGTQMSGKLVYFDADGQLRDETGVFTHLLTPRERQAKNDRRNPLYRAGRGSFRVMSWNVEHGAMFENPDSFARIAAAINPDIIALQELTDENSAEQLESWLNERLRTRPEEEWTVIFGDGGGDLRSAVASRHGIEPAEPLRLVANPERQDRHIKIAAGIVNHDGHRLLVASVHLKCCGQAEGYEEETRKIEVQAIQAAIVKVIRQAPLDGIIVTGDLNLVGGRAPLDMLGADLDLDGSELAVADLYQLDGRTNATWSDMNLPFVPGRLDYLLFTDSSLRFSHGTVFDSRDLTPLWRRRFGIDWDESLHTSDHFPLVADFYWIDGLR